MGYFSNLAIDVEDAVAQGATVQQVAKQFNLSEEQVKDYIQQLEQADRDPAELG